MEKKDLIDAAIKKYCDINKDKPRTDKEKWMRKDVLAGAAIAASIVKSTHSEAIKDLCEGLESCMGFIDEIYRQEKISNWTGYNHIQQLLTKYKDKI